MIALLLGVMAMYIQESRPLANRALVIPDQYSSIVETKCGKHRLYFRNIGVSFPKETRSAIVLDGKSLGGKEIDLILRFVSQWSTAYRFSIQCSTDAHTFEISISRVTLQQNRFLIYERQRFDLDADGTIRNFISGPIPQDAFFY